MTTISSRMGGSEKYALAYGHIHRVGCPQAIPMPGDGGYISAEGGLERGCELGFSPCPECFPPPHQHHYRKDGSCRCGAMKG